MSAASSESIQSTLDIVEYSDFIIDALKIIDPAEHPSIFHRGNRLIDKVKVSLSRVYISLLLIYI